MTRNERIIHFLNYAPAMYVIRL